jgi:uncharacterized protein
MLDDGFAAKVAVPPPIPCAGGNNPGRSGRAAKEVLMGTLQPAGRLTVFLGGQDTWRSHPVYAEIVRRARKAGLAGASVFRGAEGFGASGRIHTSRLLGLGDGLPLCVVIVDDVERIKAFLPVLDELLGDSLAVLDEVTVYSARPPGPPERIGAPGTPQDSMVLEETQNDDAQGADTAWTELGSGARSRIRSVRMAARRRGKAAAAPGSGHRGRPAREGLDES